MFRWNTQHRKECGRYKGKDAVYKYCKENNSSPYPIHLALGHERLAATVAACKKGDKFILTLTEISTSI